MRKTKHWLMTMAALLCSMAVNADVVSSGICGENLTWRITDEGELIIEGIGEMPNYKSSSSIPWYGNTSIKKVIILEGVTSIGELAFYGSDITSIVIPQTVTAIGNDAFLMCDELTSITIPEGVASIGNEVFYNCTKLSSIILPSSLRTIDYSAFYKCSSLTSIEIPEGVTSIGNDAFRYCSNLTKVILPSSLTSIGSSLFYYCDKLTTIVNRSITPRGSYLFDKKISGTLYVPTSAIAAYKNSSYSSYFSNIKAYDPSGKINNGLTWSLTEDGELRIEGTGAMADYSYPNKGPWSEYNELIEKVAISNGVTSVGSRAFYGCSYVETVDIPVGVTRIGYNAFYNCRKLNSITIPESVNEIQNSAFAGCSNLSTIICYAINPPNGGDSYFYNVDKTIPLYVPAASIPAYQTAEEWKDFTNIQPLVGYIASGTTYGGNLTWKLTDEGELTIEGEGEMKSSPWSEYESSIKSVVIGEGVTSINSYAFFNCTNLTSIDIPESVCKIGQYAFANTGWYNNQPNGLVYIENWLYGYKGEMPENFELVVEDGTKGIADYAFESSSNLMMATIPESVSYIGDAAFIQSGLGLITMSEGVKSIGGGAFWGCYRLAEVSIPESVTEVGNEAFHNTAWYWKQSCGILYLSGWALEVKICGDCENCERMDYETANILHGIKGIAEGFTNFSSIVIPESVTYLREAFTSGGTASIVCKSLVPPSDVDGETFSRIKNSSILYVPANAVNLYKADKYWGEFATIKAIDFPLWTLTMEGELIIEGSGAMDNYECERTPWAIYDEFIKSVTIKEGITSIGDEAFAYCEEMVSVSLPNSLQSIGMGAFAICDKLKSVVIPENVTTIGSGAFISAGLSSITCKSVVPPVVADGATFHDVSKSIPVYVPLSSIPSYRNAEYWNEFTNIQATPEYITINQYGSATYCSEYALDFSEVEGLKAYAATGYDTETGVVTLSRVMTAKAGVGLFIKGDPGDYEVPVLESTSFNTLNMLVGTSEAVTLGRTSEDGLYVNYKYTLSGDNATPQFYVFDDGFTLGAGKAYLQIPTTWLPATDEAKSISLRFDDGEGTTDMENSQFTIDNSQLTYDLYGRRVDNPVKGGIYIVGGKKVVVK